MGPCIYTVQREVFGDHKGNWENAWASSRMTLMTSGKFLVTEGTSKKDSQELAKRWRSYRVILSWVWGDMNVAFRLERAEMKLFNDYPVSAWLSTRHLDRREILDTGYGKVELPDAWSWSDKGSTWSNRNLNFLLSKKIIFYRLKKGWRLIGVI